MLVQDAQALVSAEEHLRRLGGAEAPPPAERDALIRVGRRLLYDLLSVKVRAVHRQCCGGIAEILVGQCDAQSRKQATSQNAACKLVDAHAGHRHSRAHTNHTAARTKRMTQLSCCGWDAGDEGPWRPQDPGCARRGCGHGGGHGAPAGRADHLYAPGSRSVTCSRPSSGLML